MPTHLLVGQVFCTCVFELLKCGTRAVQGVSVEHWSTARGEATYLDNMNEEDATKKTGAKNLRCAKTKHEHSVQFERDSKSRLEKTS